MNENKAVAETHEGKVQSDLSAEIHAALALSRATLFALASLSGAAQSAVETALEDEADQAPDHARAIVEDARDRIMRAPAEARMAAALSQALMSAADALPARKVA